MITEAYRRLAVADWNTVNASADFVASCVVKVVSEGLGWSERTTKRRLHKDHAVCSILVEMVKVLNAVTVDVPAAIGQYVQQQVKASGLASTLDAEIAGASAELITRDLIDIATGGQLRLLKEKCRIWALVLCPDPAAHPDVVRLCATPIAESAISAKLKQDLEEIAAKWVT